MQSVLILGRQPTLGLAEIESLYGEKSIVDQAANWAVLKVDACNLSFDRLGGSLKLGTLLTEIAGSDWKNIEHFLIKASPDQSLKMEPGKMTLGLSAYNLKVTKKEVLATAIKIKKAISNETGRSVRVVPGQDETINTASVIHNKLTSPKAWEILLVGAKNKTYVAQTVKVQDIRSYAKRDQARPFRDARVGMLPPKLAQIIINLASPSLTYDENDEACEPIELKYEQTVLDPFCGSGVILQEALLMGFKAIGTDIDSRMADYAQRNIDWVSDQFKLTKNLATVKEADARSTKWDGFDFVATETNLGKPLSNRPSSEELALEIRKVESLTKDFLKNLASQVKPNSKHCLAIPAWRTENGSFKTLPLIDHLSDLGYNLVDFKHLNADQLIYYRPDQIVARQLLVITRK